MRDYKIIRVMELSHIAHSRRDERIWGMHADGMTVPKIAAREDCDEDAVRAVISSMWGKDTIYWERQHESAMVERYGI